MTTNPPTAPAAHECTDHARPHVTVVRGHKRPSTAPAACVVPSCDEPALTGNPYCEEHDHATTTGARP